MKTTITSIKGSRPLRDSAATHFPVSDALSSDAIFELEVTGVIRDCGDAAPHYFGYSKREVIGETSLLFSPFEKWGDMRDMLTRVIRCKSSETVETKAVHKDGTVIPVVISAAPRCDEHGNIVGAVEVFHSLAAIN